MSDTVRHLSSITFFNPHFSLAGCDSPHRTGEPVLALSTCGTRLSSLGRECRRSHSNPVLSDSQAQLSPTWAESPKRKAGGDKAVSSEHPGMTFSVPVADCSLSTQTAKEPWVWDPSPWQGGSRFSQQQRPGGEERRLPALPIIPDAPDRSFPEWKNFLLSVSSFHSRKPPRARAGPGSFLSFPPHPYLVVPPELLALDTYQGTFLDHEHPDWCSETCGVGRLASCTFPSTAMPLIEYTYVLAMGWNLCALYHPQTPGPLNHIDS